MLEVTSHRVPQVKRTKIRHIGEPPDKLFPMAFFDGAAVNQMEVWMFVSGLMIIIIFLLN